MTKFLRLLQIAMLFPELIRWLMLRLLIISALLCTLVYGIVYGLHLALS